MCELRDRVVRQLSQAQGVPDPTSMADVSPYAQEVFSTPRRRESASTASLSPRGIPRPSNSLPVGERIPASKTFGKRVYDGGIPQPLPPSSPHTHSRFGKRMNIELESKRRDAATAAVHVRKPDKESIFSERYDHLRRGILNVDDHKPCMRLPSASRDHRKDCVPGLPDPRLRFSQPRDPAVPRSTAQDSLVQSGKAPRIAPPTRSAGFCHEKPSSPRDVRYTHTATGAVLQREPRALVADASKAGRPQPQTVLSIGADM
jgi:hypothetical protein